VLLSLFFEIKKIIFRKIKNFIFPIIFCGNIISDIFYFSVKYLPCFANTLPIPGFCFFNRFFSFISIEKFFKKMTQTFSNVRNLVRTFPILFATLLFCVQAGAQVSDEPVLGSLENDFDSTETRTNDNRVPWVSNSELENRLNSLPFGCIRPRLTGAVRGYVNTYTVRKRAKCEAMLGKRIMYFPLFEKYLKAADMPSELKYLAVTESALNPTIVSSAGAVGLWQFMPATGREYGMDISRACDERCDPNQSTQAAIKYLKKLYIQFGSWELALAAYNSGAGRVSSAIRRAHSTNFWKIQNYLPEETRNYVPAFIAAMYVCHYYEEHNLQPDAVDMEAQITSSVQIFETMTFSEISDATGVSRSILKLLNPQYNQQYIPKSSEGHYLMLPARVMPAFLKWINGRGGRQYSTDAPTVFAQDNGKLIENNNYMIFQYRPGSGESMEDVAGLFGLNAEHLKIWNNSPWGGIVIGGPLKIYQPYSVLERQNVKMEGSKVAKKPAEKPTAVPPKTADKSAKPKVPPYHIVQRGESLEDIAVQYGMNVEYLLSINPKINMRIGSKVVLKN
jgi:membrane-bound lytic murein transglycosylase D